MGYPSQHEQPTLLLLNRTIVNLEYVWREGPRAGLFEVTQLVNSFMGVFAHPWDQLLDREKLEKEPLSSRQFLDCQFPEIPALEAEGGSISIAYVHDYLRVIRNAMAHGNFELLNRKQLRALRQKGRLPGVQEHEIAGLKLWNTPQNSNRKNWITILDVYEMRACIYAMAKLCEKRSLWKPEVLAAQEERERHQRRKASA